MKHLPMKNLLTILSLLLCSIGFLHGQRADEDVINVEVIELSGQKFPEFYYDSPSGEHAPLPVGKSSRGRIFEWQRKSTFPIFKKITSPEDVESIVKVAEIAIPPGEGDLLILFYINAAGKLQNKVVARDAKKHVGSSARMINLTDQEIAFVLGEDTYRISENQEKIINLKVAANERFRFVFKLLDPNSEHTRSPIKTLRLLNPQMRFMSVFSYKIVTSDDNEDVSRTLEPYAFRIYDYADQ
jgi:hypothetical protein